MSPVEELQALNRQVENATDLEELRPIFERMTAISHDHPDDFEVILAVDQVRRHIVDKGKVLREQQEALEQEYVDESAEGAEPEVPEPGSPAPPSDAFDAFTGPPVTPPVGSGIGATQTFGAPATPPQPPATGAFPTPPASQAETAKIPPPVTPPAKPVFQQPPPLPVQPKAPAPAQGGGGGRKFALIGGVIAVLALIGGGAFWFLVGHKPGATTGGAATTGTVAVNVTTSPEGASVQINGEAKCKSNCRVDLAPGNYQLTAVLEGFEPGAAALNVIAGNPMSVNLSLTPQPGSLRLMSDIEAGTVMLDGKPAGNVQDGQFTIDRIAAGPHVVRVSGKGADVEIPFEMVTGQQPVVTGPVKAGGMLAVVVTSMGPAAKVYSNISSKLAVNGQPQGQTDPKGLELKDVPAGEQTLSLGEGQAEKRLIVSFGAAPSIAAFIKKPDVTTGTLVVSTGEDDVTVSLNGKEVRRKTSRGTLRIPAVGAVVVHVAKSGFQPEPDQRIEIAKGEEKKVTFHLKPLPKVAALQIHNAVPGTQILLDDQPVGRVGPDGTFSAANLSPGEHSIEARREGFMPKKFSRSFKAGETTSVPGAEIALAAAGATVHVSVTPGDAAVFYRRTDETQLRSAGGNTLKLDPGSYVFVARAPSHAEKTVSVTIASGESRNIEIALNKVEAPKPRPTVTWAGWSKEGQEFVRRGGNRVVVASGPMTGTLSFTAHLVKGGGMFRSARLRWFIDEGTGNTQYELDKRKFQAKGPAGSRSKELPKEANEEDTKTYSVEVEISPDRIVHKVKSGGSWVTVDSHAAKVGADNKFGFVLPGSDEISISDLQFTPK